MFPAKRLIPALVLVAGLGLLHGPAFSAPPAVGSQAGDFTLTDVGGQRYSLYGFKDKKAVVVVFIGVECPIANLYLTTLAAMHHHYAPKGVQFLAVNSNSQDTLAEVVTHAKEHKVPFPVFKDVDYHAADSVGATRTPEAFLLDSRHIIRYRGRIDDQYGFTYRRASPSSTELKDAIEELLAGKAITITESKVQGCVIGRVKNNSSNQRTR
jgi:peroxiredoxin